MGLSQQEKEALPTAIPFKGYHLPLQPHQLVGGFWRIDHSFQSVLTIKNIVEIAPINVTPVLVLANGATYPLPPVALQPAGVASIDINKAVSSLNLPSTAAFPTFGTINLKYEWHWDGAIIGEVQNIDSDRSLSYSSGLRPDASDSTIQNQVTEGLWWRRNPHTGGFLRFTDTAKEPVTVTAAFFNDNPSAGILKTQTVYPGNTFVLDLKAILDALPGSPQQGGVRVSFRGPVNGMVIDGGLEDDDIGFSARLTLGNTITLGQNTLSPAPRLVIQSSVGMMIGRPDADMMFPSQISFHPYLVMRNTTGTQKVVSLSVNYMFGTTPTSVPLLDVKLPANASRAVDAESALGRLNLNPGVGYVNLMYSFSGRSSDVLLSAGSVDTAGTYVFETPAALNTRSMARTICHWLLTDGVDTMFTVWNHGTSAEDLLLTFSFDGGSYKLPIHLEAQASAMLSMADIVAHQQPDADGNLIPATLTEGSAKLAGSRSEVEHIDVTMSVASYNASRATCNIHCISCSGGYNDGWADPSPIIFPVSDSQPLTATVQSSSGTQYHIVPAWRSENTAVATVQGSTASAVAPGATGIVFDYTMVLAQACGAPPVCEGVQVPVITPVNVTLVSVTGASLWGNTISVSLYGGSGTTGILTITLVGSATTYSFQYGSGAIGPGSYSVPMIRPSIPADKYTSITAVWTVSTDGGSQPTAHWPINWDVLGIIRHSQYNTPYESTCAGPTAPAWTIVLSNCKITPITPPLNAQFANQVYINGTGVSRNYGVLKYTPGLRNSCVYPPGSDDSNTFLQVTSITGTCNTALNTSSVATYPNPYSDIITFGCQDTLALITSANSQQAQKYVEDYCPACNTGFNGTNGHIDNYSSSQACSGNTVGDYGNFWTADTYAGN